jgi:amidohydrolase
MPSTAAENSLCQALDARRDDLVALADTLWRMPELGFHEFRTSAQIASRLEDLGLSVTRNLGVTGMRVDLVSGRAGPTLALLAELDGICLPEHPAAEPETGAVHACGHHAQLTALVGCAAAFVETGLADRFGGNLALIVVPAEEYLDLEYRRDLVRQGRLTHLSGKRELLHLGVFDDIDLSLMIHLVPGRDAMVAESMNGFLLNSVTFRGRAAHAGLAPHEGINALNAAHVAMSALNVQRETFRDRDAIRLHHVITHGGDALNVVPERVCMECKLRARTVDALRDIQSKVMRSLRAGALAVGAGLDVETTTGYLPMINDDGLTEVYSEALSVLASGACLVRGPHRGSSTDMGDLSQIMPALHGCIGGAEGSPHSTSFRIVDPDLALIGNAKMLALCAWTLLRDDAARAREVLKRCPPALTRDQYWRYVREHTGRTSENYA